MYIILFVSVLCLPSNILATYEINVNDILTKLRDVTPRDISDVENIVTGYGYPFENHEISTEDGYILSVHRIPHGKDGNDDTETKPAVLIMHGLLSSSVDFFILGPGHSLALMLADQGYDVWLGNNRGTTYSRNHTSLDPDTDATFWDYSFHELGIYDVTAIIDHILDATGNEQISYVGHSQGTTQYFSLASTKAEYNDKVNVMVALGPSAYQQNLTNPIILLAKDLYTILDVLAVYLNITEVVPHSDLLSELLKLLCGEAAGLQEICLGLMFFIVGFDPEQIDRSTFETIFDYFPAGSSLKEYKHFLQEVKSGHFRQFDYGIITNFEKYNQASPPDYDLSLITTPVALYYGQNDLLVGIPDVERLAEELPNVVEKHLIEYEKFNHADFIFGKDVESILYFYVVNLLNQVNGFNNITSTTVTTTTPPTPTTRTTTPTTPTTPTTATTTTQTTSILTTQTTITTTGAGSTGSTGNSNSTSTTPTTTPSSALSINNYLSIYFSSILLITVKLM